MKYDASNDTEFSEAEVQAVVGRRATLPFTGEIVDAGVTEGVGAYVRFQVDDRWGFRPTTFRVDLDALELDPE